ncbi:uncharacterized protein LOC144361685 [Saccoglossus kowalevskii]
MNALDAIHNKNMSFDWSIKGYHHFHRRPHPDALLDVEIEHNNRYDPSSMLVKMPPLCRIPNELHDEVTREGRGNQPNQTVRSIADKQVGRVPANLCKVFRRLLELNLVESVIVCKYTGQTGLSIRPPSNQRFQRGQVRDRPGGGAELTCLYYLKYHEIPRRNMVMEVFNICRQFLTDEELERIAL